MASQVKSISGRTLAGAVLIAFVLGSLHSFSVLVEPLELALGAQRSSVAFIYSLATLSLVAGVYVSSDLFGRVGASRAALLCGVGSVAGLLLIGLGDRLWMAFAGFGLLFGFANGIGYALSIERAGLACPERRGVCLGLATAAYCAGAIVFSRVFAIWATPQTYASGLHVLAGMIFMAALISAALFRSGPQPTAKSAVPTKDLTAIRPQIARLWVVYFLGVLAGMMALGHAAPIVSATGGTLAQKTIGAMLISAGSAVGSIGCGWLADRWSPGRMLRVSLAGVASAMLLMAVSAGPVSAIAGLSLIGVAYGALITVIPVISANVFSREVSLAAFGRIFTAWGAAGLAGPWFGGVVFDISSDYTAAFWVAAACAIAALAVSRRGGA